MRSLQAVVFQAIAIPAGVILFILAGVINLSLHSIYTDMVERQRMLIEILAQQGNQYLAETARFMATIAETIPDLAEASQAELVVKSRTNCPRFVALYLLNPSGRVILEDTDTFSRQDLDLSGEPYFSMVKDSGEIYFSDSFLSPASGQTSIMVAAPIFGQNQFQGVLVGEVSLALLQQQIIEQANLEKNSVSFIVDQQGTLLAHPNQDWVQERRHFGGLPLVQAGLAGQETVRFWYDQEQQQWLIGSVSTMRPGWVVVTTQPVAGMAHLIEMLTAAGAALGLSLVTFFVLQRRSLRQITSPISLLAQKATALAGGQYEAISGQQMGNCREIVSLGQSFTRMVEAVRSRDLALAQQVTDFSRAEQETRRTQFFLDAIIENIPHTIFVKDARSLNYVLCNRAAEEFFGLSKEEMIGKDVYDLYPPEAADRYTTQDHQALNLRKLVDIPEEVVQTRHQGLRKIHTKKLAILEKDGEPQFLLSILQDITERKQAEQALRDSEEKNRALSEATYEALFFSDRGICVEANPAASKMFGYSYDELIGIFGTDVIAPESKEIVRHNMLSGYEQPYEAIAQRKDGSTFSAEFEGRMYEYKGRKVRVTAVRDITGRKQAEEALRESEERHRSIMQNLSDIVWVVDEETRIKYVTPSGSSLLGYAEEDLVGKIGFDLVHPEDMPRVEQAFVEVLQKNNPYRPTEFRLRHAAGHWIYVEVVGKNMLDHPVVQGIVLTSRDVSERKQATEERDRLFNLSIDMLCIAGFDGYFKQLNPAWSETLGWPREILLQKSWLEFVHPEDQARTIAAGQQLAAGEAIYSFENRYLCQDGSYRWLSWNACPLPGEQVIYGVVRDITGRKQAEEALRDSEARFRSTFEQAAVGMEHVALDGRFIRVNQRFCEIVQYSQEELLKLRFQDITHPADLKTDLDYVGQVLAGKINTYSMEKRYLRRDGSPVWTNLTVSIVRTHNGEPGSLLGVVEDISERKQVEEALYLNEIRMKALLELNQMTEASLQEIADYALEEAVRLTKSEIGYLAFMNKEETVLTMYSWSKRAREQCEIVDKPVLFPVDTTGLWGEAVRQRKPIITNDYSVSNPYKKGYPYGHVQLKRHLNIPVFDSQQIVAVAGVGNKVQDYDESDIQQLTLLMQGMWRLVQRKRAAEEIRTLNEELEQRVIERTAQLAATNREMEAFAYSVSHDLRAPLRSINGFSQMLLEDYSDKLGPEGQDYLQRVCAASDRMGELIDDLLQLSRLTRGELHRELVELSVLAAEIAAQLHKAQPDQQVEFIISPGLVASGDIRLVRVVLDNLLGNAWKFTGKRERAKIEFGCLNDKGKSIFYVRDNGSGFDMAYADKLFGAFQRLHKVTEFEGTGIGLATVQRIITRHGGRVWAEGAVDQGACFYFTLGAEDIAE